MSAVAPTVPDLLEELRRGPLEGISQLTDFLGAHPNTVGGWLLRTRPYPTGETLIRVACFFELQGRKVAELERADPLAANMARHWGLGLVSVDKLNEVLGYTATGTTALLSYFYGHRTPLPRRLGDLAAYLDELEEDYEARRAELRERFAPASEPDAFPQEPAPPPSAASPAPDVPRPGVVPQAESPPGETAGLPLVSAPNLGPVELAALLLRSAAPLIELIESDASTDEDRDKLRRLVGRDLFVELSTFLNRLTSWRVREKGKR